MIWTDYEADWELAELAYTYCLIFSDPKEDFSRRETPPKRPFPMSISRAKKRVVYHNSDARRILRHYLSLQAPGPPPGLEPTSMAHDAGHMQPALRTYLDSPSCSKVSLNMCMHMEALLAPIGQGHEVQETILYRNFPTFENRIRRLKHYLDQQPPQTLGQAWKDRRNVMGYYAFWSVIFVGIVTIILGIVSIAISSAQTAAAFQALKGFGAEVASSM